MNDLQLVAVLSEGELLFRHTRLVPACFGLVARLRLTAGPAALLPTLTAVVALPLGGSPMVEHRDLTPVCLWPSATK